MSRAPGSLRFFESRVGRVVRDHQLIHDGDTILVASICVRDALPLLDVLARRRQPVPPRYGLAAAVARPSAVVAPPGWSEAAARACSEAGAAFLAVELPSPEATLAPSARCEACRRAAMAALTDLARSAGCGVVALADDLDAGVESALRGMIESGEVRALPPAEVLASGVRLIRPLVATEARFARRYARDRGLPDAATTCPFEESERRLRLPAFLAALGGASARIRYNIARAVQREHDAVVTRARTR